MVAATQQWINPEDIVTTPPKPQVAAAPRWVGAEDIAEPAGPEAVRGMEQLGGVAPSPPKPPQVIAPPRQRTPMEMAVSGMAGSAGAEPGLWNPSVEGGFEALHGTQKVADAFPVDPERRTEPRAHLNPARSRTPPPPVNWPLAAEGGADIIEGGLKAAAPLVPASIAAAPVAALSSLALGSVAGYGTEKALNSLGAHPQVARFGGAAASVIAGGPPGVKALGKLHESMGSPEVRFGKFPEPKPFGEMSDAELLAHRNTIETERPPNYDWQRAEIAKEVGKRQAEKGMGAGPESQQPPETPPAVKAEAPPATPTDVARVARRMGLGGQERKPIITPPPAVASTPPAEKWVDASEIVEKAEPVAAAPVEPVAPTVAAPPAVPPPASESGSLAERESKADPALTPAPSDPADQLPQPARTAGGKVKMGADVESLGRILGSSLYGKSADRVIPKELLQNAMDAVRGVAGGKVTVHTSKSETGDPAYDDPSPKLHITVTDNGPGMTREMLETVFTDLGSSGKRGQADASGGFGIAKAAPLMMSESVTVTSVVQEPGGRFQHTFTATPEDLLGEGVDIHSTLVGPDVATGTEVRSTLNNADGKLEEYNVRRVAEQYGKSVAIPGELHLGSAYGYPRKINREDPLTMMADATIPGVAEVKIYRSPDVGAGGGWNGIQVEVNNNGIFQFEHSVYAEGANGLKDVPKRIAVDVRSLVPEGDKNYPFAANRESMRDVIREAIDKVIKREIIDPAMNALVAFMGAKYDSLPTFADYSEADDSGQRRPPLNIPFYDVGAKLDPDEAHNILHDPEMVRLAEGIHEIVAGAIDLLNSSDSTLGFELSGAGLGVERIGLVFSEAVHGVYVPSVSNPGKATLLINPFSFRPEFSVRQIASLVWHTIKHELVHDKIKGHHESFTTGEVEVAHALAEMEDWAIQRLKELYGDDEDSGRLRGGLAGPILAYNESRGREPRERDPLGGESSAVQPGGHGMESHDPARVGTGDAGRVREGGGELVRHAGPPPVGSAPRSAEAGFIGPALTAAPRAIEQLFKQDIWPAFKYSAGAAKAITDGIIAVLSPRWGMEHRGKRGSPERATGVRSLDRIYQMFGDRNRALFLVEQTLNASAQRFGKMTEQESVDFVDRVKTGTPQPTQELRNIAELFRRLDDEVFAEASKFSNVPYLKDHYRVIWKVIPKSGTQAAVLRTASRGPLQGSMKWAMRHVYDTMSEGIKAGGVPVSYNPAEMFMLHYIDMTKFVTVQKMFKFFRRAGEVKFVKGNKPGPDGFVRLNDRLALRYFPATGPGGLKTKAKAGEYWIREDAGRILNNHLSKDLLRDRHADTVVGRGVATVGRTLLAGKNFYTRIELGFSPFHATLETLLAGGSVAGVGLRQAVNTGQVGRGLKNIVKGMTVIPGAVETFRAGRGAENLAKVIARADATRPMDVASYNAWLASREGRWLKQNYPAATVGVNAYFNGGGKLGINPDFRNTALAGIRTAAAAGNPIGAALRKFPIIAEFMTKWLFEYYVPRIKLGLFLQEFEQERTENLKRASGSQLTDMQMSRKTVDFVEDRAGEMNMDNLFWNRTLKTIAQFVLRAPTFRFGTVRAVGGVAPEQMKELAAAFRDKRRPMLSAKAAWLLGEILVGVVVSDLIMYMMTGKHLTSLKDIFHPQVDPKDSSVRVSTPTYARIMYDAITAPFDYLLGGLSGTLSKTTELVKNRDYHGQKVYNEDDPTWRQGADIGMHYVPKPFSVDSIARQKEMGQPPAVQALGVVGFPKSAAAVSDTSAVRLAKEYEKGHEEVGGRTREQAQKIAAKAAILRAMRSGRDAEPVIANALKAGFLTQKDVGLLWRQAKLTQLQAEVKGGLTAEQSMRVWEKATTEEKKQIDWYVRQKLRSGQRRPGEWNEWTRQAAKKYFGIQPSVANGAAQ